MSPRVATADRTVLTLLGLLLLAAGVVGLVLSSGGFGPGRADSPLVPTAARQFAADQPWLRWAIAAHAYCSRCCGCGCPPRAAPTGPDAWTSPPTTARA